MRRTYRYYIGIGILRAPLLVRQYVAIWSLVLWMWVARKGRAADLSAVCFLAAVTPSMTEADRDYWFFRREAEHFPKKKLELWLEQTLSS